MIYDEVILNDKGEEVVLKKQYTVCITGHRSIKEDLNFNDVKNQFIKAIEDGYDTFLNGMAVGFDQECLKILLELKKHYNLRVIACIPCINQSERWSFKSKIEYKKFLSKCDEIIYISKEKYTAYCMKERNKFMVEHSSRCICYLRDEISGTASTYKMAKSKGLDIFLV